jgi:hypothetical protein
VPQHPRWYEARLVGAVDQSRIPRSLFDALARHVEAEGLLPGGTSERNQYRVVDESSVPSAGGYRTADAHAHAIHIEAANSPTAITAGLDDLRMWQEGDHTIRYEVTFRRWARNVGVASIAIAAASILAVFLLVMTCMVPPEALAVDAVVVICCTAAFPLIRIVLHRRRLRVLVEQVVGEAIFRAATRVEPATASAEPSTASAEDEVPSEDEAHERIAARPAK